MRSGGLELRITLYFIICNIFFSGLITSVEEERTDCFDVNLVFLFGSFSVGFLFP